MQPAVRGAWIVGWLACWLNVATVHAQRAADAASDRHDEVARSAVFLLPDLDAETQARLRDALLAQFALLDARLVLEAAPSLDPNAADRMGEMQERAAAYRARAAFSIDEHSDGRWFVYLLDVERERLVVRPVDAGAGQRGAAIEAVALMARESTRALLEGGVLPETPAAAEAPAEPRVAPPAPTEPTPEPVHKSGLPPIRRTHSHLGLRLWLAYAGSNFANQVGLRHAGVVGAGWLGLAPWYGALSAELAPPIELDAPVAFQVQRLPLRLHAGHRYQQGAVVFDLELAVTAELLVRRSARNQPGGGAVQVVAEQGTSSEGLVAVGPRARVELLVLPWAGLAAELGLDGLLNANNFSYLARTSQGLQTLLRPSPIRPFWSLAMAFYP